jgi:DNA polymerase III sliding clamp (beta) subunit (PCNA family)
MDKRIIKAMLTDVASTDSFRPTMCGVHFEKDRCYATDTHILVVYNVGSEKHDGKTINFAGEEIKGMYPAVDRVIDKKPTHPHTMDMRQLYRACNWWSRQSDHHQDDRLVIKHQAINIKYLAKVLNLFNLTSELGSVKMWLNEKGRPLQFRSDTFTAIIMPCEFNEDSIDEERLDSCSPVYLSYANLVNTFAIESCRPKDEGATPLGWL